MVKWARHFSISLQSNNRMAGRAQRICPWRRFDHQHFTRNLIYMILFVCYSNPPLRQELEESHLARWNSHKRLGTQPCSESSQGLLTKQSTCLYRGWWRQRLRIEQERNQRTEPQWNNDVTERAHLADWWSKNKEARSRLKTSVGIERLPRLDDRRP